MIVQTGLRILGTGAVSTAGWGVEPFISACLEAHDLPSTTISRPEAGSRDWSCRVRAVPALPPDVLPKSPRLRRASPITKFMLAAALEALKSGGFTTESPPSRLGIIQVLQNGAVQYSGRFFGELLVQPTMPSPLIFPETVFNAPASHVAQCLSVSGAVTTIIGESNLIVEALLTASQWIDEGVIDHCLIVAGEELDWLSAEAATYYHKNLIATEGAAALLVAKSAASSGVALSSVCPLIGHHDRNQRQQAMNEIAKSLLTATPTAAKLVRQGTNLRRLDAVEASAWSESQLEAIAPRDVIGDAMGAAAALQIVLAHRLAWEAAPTLVSLPGGVASSGLALSL